MPVAEENLGSDGRAAALAGRRLLDLCRGPRCYAGKLFADLGADVVKVELPSGVAVDDSSHAPEADGGASAGGSASAQRKERRSLERASRQYFDGNKRSVCFNWTDSRGARLLHKLAASADALIEDFPPGRLAGAGVGPDQLRSTNPELIVTSVSGFGQDGPRRDYRSSDLVAQALGGSMHVIGEADDPPVRLAGNQSDVMSATMAAISTLIALLARSRCSSERTSRGEHVDISMQEVTASVGHITGVGKWLDDGIIPRRSGSGLFASVPSGAYRCRDGLIYVTVNRPAHWRALAEWIHEETGNKEVLDSMFDGASSVRIPYRDLVDFFVGELMKKLTVDEAYHEGQRRHIAVTPVADAAMVLGNEHLSARGFFVEAPGSGRRVPGAPYRHSLTPWRLRRSAPEPGEHNREVFCGELGLSENELVDLKRSGVI